MEDSILKLMEDLKQKCTLNDKLFMQEAGITQAEYNFFIVICSCDEIVSNVVAEKMNLSLSRVSRVVDNLVNKKLIRRRSDKKDRRAIKLSLTESGKKLKHDLEAYRKECELRFLDNLSEEEMLIIKESFFKVLSIL